MLLGIFSDTHLGFSSKGDDRFEESFARFNEALSIFAQRKADFILHAGDLFDAAVPEQEVWEKTFECFNNNNGPLTKVTKHQIGGEVCAWVKGTPIIAIHGTHEFRGKDFANAIAILEKANCLVHIHAGHVVLEKNGEKAYVHGMGGVPEKHAKEVLEKYGPRAMPGFSNVIMFHQSFKEFLPFDDDDMIATLSLADLPDGFDLVVDGHLHWSREENISNKRFLLTGSTIFTQMKKLEGERDKGVFLFDTASKKLEFVPFKNQRKLFYFNLKFDNAQPQEVARVVQEKIAQQLNSSFPTKPLVRVKISGTLAKGFSQSDVLIDLKQYESKAIFSVSKEFSTEAFSKKIDGLRTLQAQKASVLEIGVGILEKNVGEANLTQFDTRRVFDLLSADETDKAREVILAQN